MLFDLWDGDGVTDEVTRSYSAVESGLEIRQDDGTVLFRHDYADLNNVMGTEAMLYRVGGKTYLVIEENGYMDGSEERFRSYTIYLIDSKANTIKELKRSSCVRAYPNPALSEQYNSATADVAWMKNVIDECVNSTSRSTAPLIIIFFSCSLPFSCISYNSRKRISHSRTPTYQSICFTRFLRNGNFLHFLKIGIIDCKISV